MAEQEEHKIKKRKLSGDPVIVVGDDEEDEEDAGEEDEEGVEAVEGDDGEEALEGSEEQEAEDQEDDYSGAEEAVLKLEEAQNLIEKVTTFLTSLADSLAPTTSGKCRTSGQVCTSWPQASCEIQCVRAAAQNISMIQQE